MTFTKTTRHHDAALMWAKRMRNRRDTPMHSKTTRNRSAAVMWAKHVSHPASDPTGFPFRGKVLLGIAPPGVGAFQ